MASYQPLKGITDINEYTLNNDIQDGLLEYFDWALMDIGNYFNVNINEQSPDGYDYSKLTLSSDPNFTKGQVWEGFRKNWIWQSGVEFSPSPLVGSDSQNPGVSGVYVDDQFYSASTTGDYAHYCDHFNGRVVFDSPIPTGSKVQAEFSYKWINVVYANSVPWLREIQTDTQQPNSNFYDQDKGKWNIPVESRLQLPAIAIEIVPNRNFSGFQLGGGQWVYTDVLFHCIAEDEITRNKLVDIVSLQNDKTIYTYDSNKINESREYPIDFKGKTTPSALRYPDLLDKYKSGKIRLTNGNVQNMTAIGYDLYGGVVRFRTEYINTKI
jgi:hypothetical protein